MTTLTREALRERIDNMERLSDVLGAISDVESADFDPEDSGLVNVVINCRDDSRTIAFVHGLPPSAVLAGLREMQRVLSEALKESA